jgi:hypothetical protein
MDYAEEMKKAGILRTFPESVKTCTFCLLEVAFPVTEQSGL